MPFKARRPAGGFRVMYEYANRLSELGYSVHITYPIITKYMKYRFPYFIRLVLSYLEGFRTYEWFDFHKDIKRSFVKCINNEYVVDADVVIATWWSTAMDMGNLASAKGKKINLIQGYEDWEGHLDLLHASYNMKGVTNVVVASYLEKIVRKYTNNSIILIPNSIDSAKFHLTKPVESRIPTSVCMMYSLQEIKGSKYGIEALKIVKEKYPELKVELFGVCPSPTDIPDWMKFYRNPKDLCDLYNRNAIFITNSLTEGFGLVSVEAMACGCALICTDIAGHKEYAVDNETALLVDVKNPQKMAEKICQLIENDDFRVDLAKRGNERTQYFSWDTATDKMDKLITDLLKDR